MPTQARLALGMLGLHPAVPGVARVGDVAGDEVRLDLFDSPARPIAESV